MPRSQNKVASHRRRKRILAEAKGYWGARSKLLTTVKHALDKGYQYAYRDRKAKKRTFRQLWIARINAAARLHGVTYSRLIDGLTKKQVTINRKVLAELAVQNPDAFAQIIAFVKA